MSNENSVEDVSLNDCPETNDFSNNDVNSIQANKTGINKINKNKKSGLTNFVLKNYEDIDYSLILNKQERRKELLNEYLNSNQKEEEETINIYNKKNNKKIKKEGKNNKKIKIYEKRENNISSSDDEDCSISNENDYDIKEKKPVEKKNIYRPKSKIITEKDKSTFLKRNIRIDLGEIKNYYENIIQQSVTNRKEHTINRKILNSILNFENITLNNINYYNTNNDDKDELLIVKDYAPSTKYYDTYLNADVRYLNIDYVVEKIGHFDVIMIDPPWRIKGGQKNDSSHMFSNSKFSLNYNTMSNKEIMNIEVEKLSQNGFIFLWILANQMDDSTEILKKWGYDLVEVIVWVKLQNGKVFTSPGFYFMHSHEICLVGMKRTSRVVEFNSKISNNIIFSEIRAKSQKPEEIYEIIDLFMPGARKVEIFARNNNLREGWFSIGNQLGPQFEEWVNIYNCNDCNDQIKTSTKRAKHKQINNFDLCFHCFSKGDYNENDFFILKNEVDEDVLHYYHECNGCKQNPIWGNRFTCENCPNFDYCETCYDKMLVNDPDSDPVYHHDKNHSFNVLELAILADGFPIHLNNKCRGCYQNPIIGVMFKCSDCKKFSLCQYCYFKENGIAFQNHKSHKLDHNFEIFMVSCDSSESKSKLKCSNCKVTAMYKCENCFKFYFCEECYIIRKSLTLNFANTHKHFHSIVKL